MSHRVVNVIRTAEGGQWIVPELELMTARGFEVCALLPNSTGSLASRLREVGVGVQVTSVDLGAPGEALRPRKLKKFRDQLIEHDPSLLLYQLIQTAVITRLASLGMQTRRVHQVPGPLFLESRVIRPVERVLSRLDDKIICGSAFTYRLYEELGVHPDKLAMIPFGVDCMRFSPRSQDKAFLRARLGLSPETFVAVMVAFAYPPKRLAHAGKGIKGHELLIEAWAQFSKRHGNALLMFVCDGWGAGGAEYRSHLEDLSRKVARPGSVRWFSGQRDSRFYYDVSDVSVAPSWSENHGSALEASAMAVPSIVSSAGGLPETVNSMSGWVFDKGDVVGLLGCLERSYEEFRSGRLRERGEAARQWIKTHFSSADCASRVADCLESVLRDSLAK